jgi:hypothetical protein
LPEILKAMGPGNGQADDFGHAAVAAEEVLGPSSSDVPTGEGGVEWGDTWPFLDGVLHRGRHENAAIMKTSAQVRTGLMLE